MGKDNYIALIYKKLKGDISLEEQSVLDIWIGQSADNELIVKNVERDWHLVEQYEPQLDIDIAADFKLLQGRIQKDKVKVEISPIQKDNLRVAHQPIGKVVARSSQKTIRPWIGWAAAAVVILALGFWFLNGGNSTNISTLALETQFGQKEEVQLADGTKIWLNGNSKLEYPSSFGGDNRTVKLKGEAFFEVAKNAEKPFIIEMNKAKVTVLGTSFNVRARIAETKTEVVVKTGKVRLENIKGDKKVELEANETGVFNVADNTIKEDKITTLNQLSWHSDVLVFSHTALEEVIIDLARQFEVSISLKNSSVATCELDGRFKTKEGIDFILNAISSEFQIELKKVGNTTFELVGGSCQ